MVCVLVALVACKSTTSVLPPKTIETIKEVTITETLRDTLIKVEKDSSFYRALVECINGKPVLKPQKQFKGRNLKPPSVKLQDNRLSVDCETEAHELFLKWKEKHIRETEKTKTTTPVAVALPLTSWQGFQIWCGRILLLIILGVVLSRMLKIKERLNNI